MPPNTQVIQGAAPTAMRSRRTDMMRPVLVLIIGAIAIGLFWSNDYYSRILTVMALAIVSTCGLNILAGVTGQISLGHAGFYAVGAYTAAILSVRYGWNVLATVPLVFVLAGILGLVLAWPALRLKGPYLTMVTIAFGLLIFGIATDYTSFTNGPEGVFPVPKIGIGGVALDLQQTNLFLLVVVAFIVYIHATLIKGRYGRAMRALRGNELAAASLGINVTGTKLLAFGISGVLAGFAGALYAPINGFVNPDGFTMELSVLMLMMVILGGSGTIWGPVAGAIVLTIIDRLLSQFGEIRLVIYGLILLSTLYLMPTGLVGLFTRFKSKAEKPASAVAGSKAEERPLPLREKGPELILKDVSKAFGGLKAVDGVSFRVAPASIHGLVGPNGAGKTTVLNMISGVITPTTGAITYGTANLGGEQAYVLARLGIGRTFQNLALFKEMTVLENVLAGLHLASGASLVTSMLATPDVVREEQKLEYEAMALLQFVGLADAANRPAADLPQGHQRMLEIARALAVHPTLLLLDEPAAGLNGAEVDGLIQLIFKIRAANITVLLIEHHMQLVMTVCDTVTVLDFGKLICEGPPDVVKHDALVLEAYLGKPSEKIGEMNHA
jgi:branched-chain amino acid transport system permease protein